MLRAIAMLSLLLISELSHAQVYKWIDSDGNVHYGEDPPVDREFEQMELKPSPTPEEQESAIRRSQQLRQYLEEREEAAKTAVETEKQVTSRPIWRAECFTPSSKLAGLGGKDPFAPISPRQLTGQEQKYLANIFQTLESRWLLNGHIEEIICIDPNKDPPVENVKYHVRSEINLDLNQFLEVESDLLTVDTNISSSEKFWLYESNKLLRFGESDPTNPNDPRWDVEVISVDNNHLRFLRKYRQSTHRGSLHRIHVHSLEVSPSSLIIKEWFYTQDELSSFRVWNLED